MSSKKKIKKQKIVNVSDINNPRESLILEEESTVVFLKVFRPGIKIPNYFISGYNPNSEFFKGLFETK